MVNLEITKEELGILVGALKFLDWEWVADDRDVKLREKLQVVYDELED